MCGRDDSGTEPGSLLSSEPPQPHNEYQMQPFTLFVSYRRHDTAPIALLLKNEIEE